MLAKNLVRPLTLSCLLLMSLPFLSAQEKEQENQPSDPQTTANSETEVQETMAVWATKVTTSSMNLDDEALAMRQADHVSDLLRTIPGVDVGGAHSLNQRITIRSMDDKDLRISIDGANQNTYMYHHMGNLQIHADILKSVALEIGKNSVINGGLGGSVRFETKDAADLLLPGQKFGSRLQSAYGDNASTGYSLTAYGAINDRVDVLAYFNRVDRDNFSVGGDIIKDENGVQIPGTDGEVRGHEGEVSDVLLKFGWNLGNLGDNHRLELSYERYLDEGDYSYRPDMGLATDLAIANNLSLPLVYPTEFSRDTLTLNYEAALANGTTIKASAFSNRSELQRDERGVAAVFGGPSDIRGEAENKGIHLLAESRFGQGITHHLRYGANLIDYLTDYRTDTGTRSGEDASHTSVFIEDRIHWQRATLVPGLRYDRYDLQAKVVDERFSEVTAGLAIEYDINDAWQVRAGSTQLFKGPEIGEVFIGAGSRDAPNPDIEAETGLNSEIGLTFNASVLAADTFSVGLTAFRTEIDDYIYDYAPNPTGRYWKDNVGDMQLDGFEAYIGYDLGNLKTLVTVSSADSELSAFASYAELDRARLDRRQGDTYSLSFDYAFLANRLNVSWNALVVSGVSAGPDLDGATFDNAKDAYAVHNLAARWMPVFLKGLALNLGIDNAFDRFYASQSSRTGVSAHPRFGKLYLLDYEPGRNLKMTASYRF